MREILFEYGFKSANGIVKKQYCLNDISNIKQKCDVWNDLLLVYIRQYTGLTDKNGVKIFEWDITKYGVVVFENGCFGVLGENDFVCFDLWNIDILEIIGNIHE